MRRPIDRTGRSDGSPAAAPQKPWFLDGSAELGAAFLRFHTSVTGESALDDKTMELVKIAVSSVLRCPHCTELHIDKAKGAGASRREITDTLIIAALQAAGTQLYWNAEGFTARLGAGAAPSATDEHGHG